MKFEVSFPVVLFTGGGPRGPVKVGVDTEDRWAAVVQAAQDLKLDGKYPRSLLAQMASVRKVERKQRASWWESKGLVVQVVERGKG
jgi:hypothetical protein